MKMSAIPAKLDMLIIPYSPLPSQCVLVAIVREVRSAKNASLSVYFPHWPSRSLVSTSKWTAVGHKVPVGVSIVNYSLVVQRLWSIRGSKQKNEEDQSNQLAFLSGLYCGYLQAGAKDVGWMAGVGKELSRAGEYAATAVPGIAAPSLA